ncbi:LOW QUALITY PROTEIN: abl interactor 2-like [Branchiostoma floridae]|uniref:LOW QUALITY PROTEIN: abl interactor 2-like n=1 Tax=Branchiostoma floridae TaxID=7739 RepID=A0A9J7KDP7_BRAFL|nr:LOW QUALITY PROTEIN: abl interactor 2-like [Branchiostoma floridae]
MGRRTETKMAELNSLMDGEIPAGRQALQESQFNLQRVADYCENNYIQSQDKRTALEETKSYTTQSLASVAYQINSLATNMLQMMDIQANQLQKMESGINHISMTVDIHKEKVARREIGVLTTNKTATRTHKIMAPARLDRPVKYERKLIDYSLLDDVGHGVKITQSKTPHRASLRVATPTTPPAMQPTNKSSDYRTPQVVRTPIVPNEYTPSPVNNRPGSVSSQYQRSSHARSISAPPPVAPPPPPGSQQGMVQSMGQQGDMAAVNHGGGAPPPPPAPPPMVGAGQQQMNYATVHRSSGRRGQVDHRPPEMTAPGYRTLPNMRRSNVPAEDPGYRMNAGSQEDSGYRYGYRTSQGPGGEEPGYRRINATSQLPMANGGVGMRPPHMQQVSQASISPTPPPPPPPDMENDMFDYGHSHTPPPPPPLGRDNDDNWMPAQFLEKVVAVYDYEREREDELSFNEGQIIYVIKKNEDGWYEGVMNGAHGLFPGNYVEPLGT